MNKRLYALLIAPLLRCFCSGLLCLGLTLSVCAQELGDAQIVSAEQRSSPGSADSSAAVLAPNSDILIFSSSAPNIDSRKINATTTDIFRQELHADGTYTARLFVMSKNRLGQDSGVAEEGASSPSVSRVGSDGQTFSVAFQSTSPDIIPENQGSPGPQGPKMQVYLRLMPSGDQILVSRQPGRGSLGGNGDSHSPAVALVSESPVTYRVAFLSTAGNLTGSEPLEFALARPMVATITARSGGSWDVSIEDVPSVDSLAQYRDLSISADGSKLIYSTNRPPMGANGSRFDAVVQDLNSRNPPGAVSTYAQLNNLATTGGSLSYSGDVRAFKMQRPAVMGDIADLYWNRSDDSLDKPSQVNADALKNPSTAPEGVIAAKVAANGEYVVFSSFATDLVSPPDAALVATRQTFLKSLSSNGIWLTSQRALSGEPFGTGGPSDHPTIGGAGFSERKFFTAFQSQASNLNEIVTPILSFQVYRVAIELPPPTLYEGIPIDSPPDILIKRRRVTITLQDFTAPVGPGNAVLGTSGKVRYSIEIKNNTTRKRIRLTTTKNRVTVRKLTPGRYTVRYRVSSKTAGVAVIKSKFSPKAPMTIT